MLTHVIEQAERPDLYETQSYAAYLGMLTEDKSSHDALEDLKLCVYHTE